MCLNIENPQFSQWLNQMYFINLKMLKFCPNAILAENHYEFKQWLDDVLAFELLLEIVIRKRSEVL